MKFNKSMVEYVRNMSSRTEEDLFKLFSYANFLSQKLELYMFVACDENGNVLEEPKIRPNTTDALNYTARKIKFETALSKVIFEGCEYNSVYENVTKDGIVIWVTWKNKTIEYLITYNLDIKESVAKELGLI